MTSLVAAATALALSGKSTATKPSWVLPADVSSGLWVVRAGSKRLVVDTGTLNTFVDTEILARLSEKDRLRLGPIDIPVPEVLGEPFSAIRRAPGFEHVDGILAMDVLKHFAVGFDRDAATVTLWDGGLDRAETKAWLLRGEPKHTTAVELEAFNEPGDARPMLYPPTGSNWPVLFDSGNAGSFIPQTDGVRRFHPIFFRTAGNIYGDTAFESGWSTHAALPGDGGELAGGWHILDRELSALFPEWSVGLDFFEGQRIVLDMVDGRFTSTTSPYLRSHRTWRQLGLRLNGGRLLLYLPTQDPKPRKYVGWEVVRIHGERLASLVKAVDRNDAGASVRLARLYDAIRKGCKATLRRSGREFTVQIAGNGREAASKDVQRTKGEDVTIVDRAEVTSPDGVVTSLVPGGCLVPRTWNLLSLNPDKMRPGPSGHVYVDVRR